VELLRALRELIDRELTERQRTALTAELGGMPLAEIAEKLGSNPNSVYKLMHDARKNLRRGMEAAGFTIDDVREAWGAGETWR
jgi:RNA polymerase sigma-70 factor, ECF subfamily